MAQLCLRYDRVVIEIAVTKNSVSCLAGLAYHDPVLRVSEFLT